MHPLLVRQLRKLGVPTGRRPTEEQWSSLLERVELTYQQADQDRYMLERSLEKCSSEMQDLYDQRQRASEEQIAKKSVQLEASLALARAIQESVAEGILVYEGAQILSWNRRFAEMWRFPEALLAAPTTDAFLAHVCSLVKSPDGLENSAKSDAAGDGRGFSADVELEDGRTFVRYRAPVAGVAGLIHGRIVCFRDVTEERRVIAQRGVVGERMASVGQLVASVAHEINNPLAYVKGNVEYVTEELNRRGLQGDAPLLEALKDTCVGVDRLTVIVRDLRALSRVDEESRVHVDIASVLESALQMANNQIRHRARIMRRLGAVPLVMANEGKLVQVFLNLLVNASQAISEGAAARNEVTVVTYTNAAGAACVEIHDTGSGIAPESLERIFDPFFTTKPVGVGTGLGLSICKGIVEKLGGSITVESGVDQGSRFVVTLPAATAATCEDSGDVPPSKRASRLRILVVDDDPMVRRMLERMLNEHVVISTPSVDEGVAALGKADFDLVLCDVMMPDRTGVDMHREVQLRWPALLQRVVFMSGGAFTPALQTFLEQPSITRLDKPLSACAVAEVVERIGSLVRRAA